MESGTKSSKDIKSKLSQSDKSQILVEQLNKCISRDLYKYYIAIQNWTTEQFKLLKWWMPKLTIAYTAGTRWII